MCFTAKFNNVIVSLIKMNEQMKTILRENQRQDQQIQISIITNSQLTVPASHPNL